MAELTFKSNGMVGRIFFRLFFSGQCALLVRRTTRLLIGGKLYSSQSTRTEREAGNFFQRCVAADRAYKLCIIVVDIAHVIDPQMIK
jgi:hypothetical protein